MLIVLHDLISSRYNTEPSSSRLEITCHPTLSYRPSVGSPCVMGDGILLRFTWIQTRRCVGSRCWSIRYWVIGFLRIPSAENVGGTLHCRGWDTQGALCKIRLLLYKNRVYKFKRASVCPWRVYNRQRVYTRQFFDTSYLVAHRINSPYVGGRWYNTAVRRGWSLLTERE